MPVKTTAELDALIVLAKSIRAESGHSVWHAPGIRDAIGRVRHMPLAEVAKAVARAADDGTLRTPAPIGEMTSSCWDERVVSRTFLPDGLHVAGLCSVCVKPADDIAHRPDGPKHIAHQFQLRTREPTRPKDPE